MKNKEIENMIEMIVYCCIDFVIEGSLKYFQQRKALKRLFFSLKHITSKWEESIIYDVIQNSKFRIQIRTYRFRSFQCFQSCCQRR